jgi:hypothetical protein
MRRGSDGCHGTSESETKEMWRTARDPARSFEQSQGRGILSSPSVPGVYLECQANALFFHSIIALARGVMTDPLPLGPVCRLAVHRCRTTMRLFSARKRERGQDESGVRGGEWTARESAHIARAIFVTVGLGADILRPKRVTLTFVYGQRKADIHAIRLVTPPLMMPYVSRIRLATFIHFIHPNSDMLSLSRPAAFALRKYSTAPVARYPSGTFPFLPVNALSVKPARNKGITEIRGPYYFPVTRTYLDELLSDWGEYVDGIKFAGGSFSLMPEKRLRDLIEVAHKHGALQIGRRVRCPRVSLPTQIVT